MSASPIRLLAGESTQTPTLPPALHPTESPDQKPAVMPADLQRSITTAAVMLAATLLAVSPLIASYGSVAVWLRAALPAAVCGCLIAVGPSLAATIGVALQRWPKPDRQRGPMNGPISGRRLSGARPPMDRRRTATAQLAQIVALTVAQIAIGPLTAGVAASEGPFAMVGAFKLLIVLQPPVGATGGSLLAVWTLALFSAYLATGVAVGTVTGCDAGSGMSAVTVRRLPWRCALAMTILLLCCAGSALLGTADGWHPLAVGSALALLLATWTAWATRTTHAAFPARSVQASHGSQKRPSGVRPRARFSALTVMVALPLAVTTVLGPAAPQHRLTLRDRYEPPLTMDTMGSPLNGMRAVIRDHRHDPLLTVTGLPEGTPVRLAVMDRFDGMVWNLSDGGNATSSGEFRRSSGTVGGGARHTAPDADGEAFTATFTLHDGMPDHWLPIAGTVQRITFRNRVNGNAGDRAAASLYVNGEGSAALLADGLSPGLSYDVSGTLTPRPGSQALARAQAETVPQPQSRDVPESVGTFARTLAGGESRAGAAADRLASSLARTGWFSHGLEGEYPSPPGHGSHRLRMLLDGDAMVGDSEQYASAMALMARELGLPSRVAYGFRKREAASASPDESAAGSAQSTSEQTEDPHVNRSTGPAVAHSGSVHSVTFTGNDIAAWTEINLDGYGWVAFHPTPPESKVPDDSMQASPPDPQTLMRQPPVPLADPLRERTRPNGQSSVTGDEAAPPPDDGTDAMADLRRIIVAVAWFGSPLWATLAAIVLILAVKALLLARARRRGTPRQRIAAGWRAVCALAASCGARLPPHGTAPDQARSIAAALHVDPQPFVELARRADHAAFSGESVNVRAARSYWKAADAARRSMLRALPWAKRWRTRLAVR